MTSTARYSTASISSTSLSRRPPVQSSSIYDRSLSRTRGTELSLGCFALLYNEMIRYAQRDIKGVQELELQLGEYGYRVGEKMIELMAFRERNPKRETKVLGILQHIHTTIWRTLFGRSADALEKSREHEDEYMISDNSPTLTQFIAVPREISQLSCSAYTAGIIEAVLCRSQFMARVTAHSTPTDAFPLRTTFLIKLEQQVIDREMRHS